MTEYDVFFEKVANIFAIRPLLRAAKLGKQFMAPAQQIITKKPLTLGGAAMATILPVGFMGLEGKGAIDASKKGLYDIGPAKNMQQTMNPWKTW